MGLENHWPQGLCTGSPLCLEALFPGYLHGSHCPLVPVFAQLDLLICNSPDHPNGHPVLFPFCFPPQHRSPTDINGISLVMFNNQHKQPEGRWLAVSVTAVSLVVFLAHSINICGVTASPSLQSPSSPSSMWPQRIFLHAELTLPFPGSQPCSFRTECQVSLTPS